MNRGFALVLGLLAALAPGMAYAQTNLDQGKSAAQIFASGCAECHKAPHGLANGRSNAALTDFLGEHYTTSREQAAALAAYVLSGRGSAPIGAPASKKPADRASASAEEPKRGKRERAEAPEEGASGKAKPQRSREVEAKPKDKAREKKQGGDEVQSLLDRLIGPENDRSRQGTAAHSRHKEQKTEAPASAAAGATPAAVAHAPATVPEPALSAAPSEATPTPAAPAPTDAASGETAPVPRDNIPD